MGFAEEDKALKVHVLQSLAEVLHNLADMKEGKHVAVVVKTVLGSHFGVGAPPILVCFSGDWDVRGRTWNPK